MAHIAEFLPGRRIVLATDRNRLTFDRAAGTLRLEDRPRVGRSRERVIALARITALQLNWSDRTPGVSLSRLRKVREVVARSAERLTAAEIEARLPPARRLLLSIGEEHTGTGRWTQIPIPLEGIDTLEKLTALGLHMATVTGLDWAGVFELPRIAPEVHLLRSRGPGSTRISAEVVRQGGAAFTDLVAQLLERRKTPPFHPADFRSDPRLTDWRPGTRVELRRPFSALAVAAAPLPLLVFGGPAAILWSNGRGRPMDVFTTIFVTVFSAAIGLGCVALVRSLLPRSVVFDWSTKRLEVRSPFRRWNVAFDEIRGLELRSGSMSTSNEGGGSTTYHCELAVLTRTDPKPRILLKVPGGPDRDRSLRRAIPLMHELARALGVKRRVAS